MTLYLAKNNNISVDDIYVSRTWIKIEFSLFFIGELFSIPCYIFVIYHFLAHKTARRALHNHVIILLLFFNFIDLTIDLSMTMNYSLLGFVAPFTPIICLIWQFVDYGIWYGSISLMFWASVERHILVFHSHLIRTKRGRFFAHYVPLLFFTLYTPILYFYLIVIYPCDRVFVNTSIRCGPICYFNLAPIWFIYYDSLANYVIPILLIAFFSAILILRFLRQKHRLKQATRWHRCRKMIIQLTLVSTSYLVFDLPYIIIVIVQSSGYPNFGSEILTPYITRLVYVPPIVLPYVTLLSLFRLKQKFRALLIWKRNRQFMASSTISDEDNDVNLIAENTTSNVVFDTVVNSTPTNENVLGQTTDNNNNELLLTLIKQNEEILNQLKNIETKMCQLQEKLDTFQKNLFTIKQ